MSERKGISKKVRFEVFKRDLFKCQYCGAEAPEAVLHVDHVKPVSKGGTNDLLNLVTACSACNLGKGARELSDDSAVKKQRAQIDELAERREQLEMMVQWRDDLEAIKIDAVSEVAERISERGSYGPNESGKASIRKWLRTYNLADVLRAVDESFDIYMKWNGNDPDDDAWEVAFGKIPGVLRVQKQGEERPWLPKLFYVQEILRKR